MPLNCSRCVCLIHSLANHKPHIPMIWTIFKGQIISLKLIFIGTLSIMSMVVGMFALIHYFIPNYKNIPTRSFANKSFKIFYSSFIISKEIRPKEMSLINGSNSLDLNVLYQTYKDSGPTWPLILPALLLNLVTIPGILMNGFVVLVTIQTKTLHGTANYLVALISAFEIFHQSGHLIFLAIVVSGINFVPMIQAVRMELPMLFATNAGIFAMVCAAFDRLFSVVLPLRHKAMNLRRYLAIHTLLCFSYGIFYVLNIYFHYLNVDTYFPTTGCISEILNGPIGEGFFRDTAVLISISSAMYLSVWLFIRYGKNVAKQTHGRLFKSLVIILSINIVGYMLTLGVYQILYHLPAGKLDPIRIWHIGFITGILLNCGSASNAIVLYVNSTNYRKAFKEYLHNLAKFLHLSSASPAPRGSWVRSSHINHQLKIGPTIHPLSTD